MYIPSVYVNIIVVHVCVNGVHGDMLVYICAPTNEAHVFQCKDGHNKCTQKHHQCTHGHQYTAKSLYLDNVSVDKNFRNVHTYMDIIS